VSSSHNYFCRAHLLRMQHQHCMCNLIFI
jgi:hypothetical protein